ncbi:conserved hypothetical protein [Sporisorium reilianum SRZ2]|uniref:Uncharacterized protein n=2 Tax=Sporisorium reilianum TaxID=72558 RepID=E7A0A9_SPORE|nr:conserved hypothetical protein [Sporisorium reilianum SRZ2]SJX62751.1 uncharacterized protein SRS1_11010 [Sporisorium reilianum f. sp. reilianum]
MTNHKPTSSGSKPPGTSDEAQHHAVEEPVPSYETALREGAGGGVGAGPSHSVSSASPAQPSYGCSPYTPNGTARIIIVPASHCRHHANQPLLPAPVSMETTAVRRARPRFFLALLQAFMIYMLINLLVDLTVTRKW